MQEAYNMGKMVTAAFHIKDIHKEYDKMDCSNI